MGDDTQVLDPVTREDFVKLSKLFVDADKARSRAILDSLTPAGELFLQRLNERFPLPENLDERLALTVEVQLVGPKAYGPLTWPVYSSRGADDLEQEIRELMKACQEEVGKEQE